MTASMWGTHCRVILSLNICIPCSISLIPCLRRKFHCLRRQFHLAWFLAYGNYYSFIGLGRYKVVLLDQLLFAVVSELVYLLGDQHMQLVSRLFKICMQLKDNRMTLSISASHVKFRCPTHSSSPCLQWSDIYALLQDWLWMIISAKYFMFYHCYAWRRYLYVLGTLWRCAK